MNLPYQLEACVSSLEEALEAQKNGVHRIEVCSHLETEGLTPSFMLVEELLKSLTIPLRVMIRHTRSGYETDEKAFLEMIYSIEKLKVLPLDGFVLGVLDKNKIDREKMKILLKAADPLHITFHKAIDCVDDVEAEIKWLNTFPQVDTILSSGKAVHASDGTEELIRMKKMFKKQIMAGGKVTPEILPSLHEKLDLQWYHGRSFVYATQPL